MPDDYYGDDEAPMGGGGYRERAREGQEGEESDPSTKTAVIDSAICPGMEPGDEMVVKIDKVLENQYLVSYAPEPGDEDEETEPEPEPEEASTPPEPPPSAMAGMME